MGGQRSSKHSNSFFLRTVGNKECEENSLLVGNPFWGKSLETGTLSSHVGFSQGPFTSFSAFPRGLFVQNIVNINQRGGGFNYVLFSPPLWEMIQFDDHMFWMG